MDTVNLNNGVVTEEDQIQTERPAEVVEPESAVRAEPFAPETSSERDRFLREKAELQDLLQRRQAEFENYRRRMEKERYDLSELAAMDTVKALLPVLDDFERALKAESADKEYARGMELIYNRFYETLRKLGLEPISNEVALFNPHIHHAVEMVDTKDHPDQTILAVYQTGYYFKGRLLRPAMVKVAVNS
ncbi:MAG: nucleotide exchange factor GrpE [Acidobacteriaceae bacterium]|nr:nucleotide exchange factor GrpE [Acidobacteriaceae bacterium]MBV9033199.1 nucleotide exchange factor GrpE [Acidobacteriaceae bacterium]MBV9226098.1 nucleotide exchange factor GrpE [Acidobacteriaceae bacterium]MBV9307012.1 nucleotide exchange factor GrpE [Acidobacteriaceae bacterium]